MDEKAVYSLTYGLYLITAADGEKRSGCVANTLAQVTSKPVKVSVALNRDNYTTSLVLASGRFAAAVMTEDTDMDVIRNFGFRSGRDADKFAGGGYDDFGGVPTLKRDMAAVFSVRVTETLDLGTHILFAGEVEDAERCSDRPVMTYAYYHAVKKGATPKNAPSYREEREKKGRRCTVCGYVYEGENLPEDFRCPVCGQGADKFVKIGG